MRGSVAVTAEQECELKLVAFRLAHLVLGRRLCLPLLLITTPLRGAKPLNSTTRSVFEEGVNPAGVLASTVVAATRAAKHLETMMRYLFPTGGVSDHEIIARHSQYVQS